MKRWSELYKRHKRQVYRVECGESVGTGWLMGVDHEKERFLVATAYHVVKDFVERKSEVRLLQEEGNGQSELVTRAYVHHKQWDICVLEVFSKAPDEALLVSIGPETEPGKKLQLALPGTEVACLGYAEGASLFFGKDVLTVCHGYVAAVSDRADGMHLYLIDGRVNQGMSGGPAWTRQGEVLGMISAYCGPGITESESGGIHAWPGFAVLIPIGYLLDLHDDMGGKIVRVAD